MRLIVMGCTVAALVALSARTEASPSAALLTLYNLPKVSRQPLVKTGMASWYGEEFLGCLTANGETYDMNGLTAASRTLPMGTKLRVTNLRNNRSLILRVNDRGPYMDNRLLDVSKAAAWKLGFMASGVAHVRLEVVSYPKGHNLN